MIPRRSLTLALLLLTARPLRAQDVVPVAPVTLTSTIDASLLRDLPTSDNIYQVLETTQPSVISDLFSGGGLFAGRAPRVGGFFGSPSQTRFNVDGLSITDPTGSGAPLAFPDLSLWQRVRVTTGVMPLDSNPFGLSIDLESLAPTTAWARTLLATTSHGGLTGGRPSTAAPPLARLEGWDRLAATATGPLLAGRLGGAFAATWNRSGQVEPGDRSAVHAEQGSAFVHLVAAPSADHDLIYTGWLSRATIPSPLRGPLGLQDAARSDLSSHTQLLWERHPSDSRRTQLAGSYTQRVRTEDIGGSSRVVFDRLLDGSVDALANAGPSTVRQWSVRAASLPSAAAATARRHRLEAAVAVSGARVTRPARSLGTAGELVNGIPARVWSFSPQASSLRRSTSVVGEVSDTIAVGHRIVLGGGLAFDAVSGSARGSATGISWASVLPRATLRWSVEPTWRTVAFAGYRRSAYQLPLDMLAVGDPGAPTADVFRWDAAPGPAPSLGLLGPLVSRAGPGSGGSQTFSRIDPDLARPDLDELVLGMETHPVRDWTIRFAGVARRERKLAGLVNTGVPASAYTTIAVPDVGVNTYYTSDDGVVTVYDRRPQSFGQDAYVLTNPAQDDSTSESVEVSVQITKRRALFFVGGSASRTDGQAANRGYGSLENDEGIVGELFTSPNASSYARGRLFADRAYTGKIVGVFALPYDLRLGVLARYQDGQPFGRVLVMTGLNQGAEVVRAYANGGSRFMFVGTLDVRLQKPVRIGRFKADLLLDAYNLPNMTNETAEDTVTGPGFRTVTLVQPPRALHAGLRLTF